MATTIKNVSSLITLTRPVVEYLRANYNPYCEIIISYDGARLVEEVVGYATPSEEDTNAARP